jgi:hypothetical protein
MASYPATLLRFFTLNANSISAIQDEKFWFSSSDKFNDPFEFECRLDVNAHGYSLSDEDLAKMPQLAKRALGEEYSLDGMKELARAASSEFDELIHRVYAAHANKFLRRMGVCCFFPESALLNPLYWAHYADSHNGFAVEIDARKAVEISTEVEKPETGSEQADKLTGRVLAPVVYRPAPVSMELPMDTETQINLLARAMSTKSPPWRDEKEWRFIQYDRANQLVSLGPVITKIYFGLRVPDHQKRLIRSVTDDRYQYYEALVNIGTYDFRFQRLPL